MRQQHTVALMIAEDFIDRFIIGRSEIAGSIRRKERTIGDVDIITSDVLQDVTARCAACVGKNKVIHVRGGNAKLDVNYRDMLFNIYFCEPNYWGAMLLFLTGPSGYSIAYRRMAKKKGWVLNQYGLYDSNGKLIASKTEKEIYEALGKEYKQPELRGK